MAGPEPSTVGVLDGESLYRSLLENLPNGFAVVFERDLRVRSLDGGALPGLGLLPERSLGKPVSEILPEQRALLDPLYRDALGGRPSQAEIAVHGRVFQVTVAPAADSQGAVHAGIALYYDISALKETEIALRRQTGLAMIHGAIAVAANEAKGILDALPSCINLICVHGDWSLGHAWLPSPDAPDQLIPTGIWNAGAWPEIAPFQQATLAAPQTVGIEALNKALRDQEPVWIEDVLREPSFALGPAAAAAGLRSGFMYPIASNGYVGAVLEFFSTSVRTREDALLLTMDIVAVQLGQLINREADHRRIVKDAESLSLVDELTALHNRRGFLRRGGQLLRQTAATGRRAFLLFIDLDGMKQINDQLGHEIGDRALVEASTLLRRCFRDDDVLARLGGDEFVVLAAEKSAIDPQLLADRVQRQVEAQNTEPNRSYQLQLSVGIEVADPSRIETLDTLVQRADQRMYEVKRARKAERAATRG